MIMIAIGSSTQTGVLPDACNSRPGQLAFSIMGIMKSILDVVNDPVSAFLHNGLLALYGDISMAL